MTQAISSAEYLQLYHYSDVALQLDNDLVGEARRLRGVLEHFEATCRDPSFRQQVAHVADGMVAYGARAAVVDAWVCVVGFGFQAADGGGLAALLPPWLPPWLLWPPIRWPVDPGFIIGPRPRPRPPQWFWPPYQWGLPPWLLPIIGWPGGRDRMIPLPVWPPRIVIPKPPEWPRWIEEPKFIIDDGRPYMPAPIMDPPPDNNGQTELGKLLPPAVKKPTVLLQTHPEYDPLLDIPRFEYPGRHEAGSETIGKQIIAYGCLMTCFTMLLRDAGHAIKVTDIYRKNYSRVTKKELRPDEPVVLENLNLNKGAISDVSNQQYNVGEDISWATIDAQLRNPEDISEKDRVKLPIILEIDMGDKNRHWIVVDSYDSDSKTYTIRDPMRGLLTVAIPSPGYKPTGNVKRLVPNVSQ